MAASLRVVMVEDDHDIAEMLRLYFIMRDIDFYHAGTGAEALDLVPRLVPHAVLMDLMLPDIDGYRLTAYFRQLPRTAHIPIIFVSEWGSREKRLSALELGAADYVVKPFDLEELVLRVQNCIVTTARENLTDLRTGLPAAFTGRKWIEQARAHPDSAIIEVALLDAIPYYQAHGGAAAADIHQLIGHLLLGVVNREGQTADFIGILDEDLYIILTAADRADVIADWIEAAFEREVVRYYSTQERQRGAIQVDGQEHPLMRLHCRITRGEPPHEVS